jgi:hypothetical protein
MATPKEYEERVQHYRHRDLLSLWEKIKAGTTSDWGGGSSGGNARGGGTCDELRS